MRLDLFLKTSRLVKRRIAAQTLCETGRVLLNEHPAKPAKEVRPGDRITLLFGSKQFVIEVLDVPLSSKNVDTALLYRVIEEKRVDCEGIA